MSTAETATAERAELLETLTILTARLTLIQQKWVGFGVATDVREIMSITQQIARILATLQETNL